MDNATQAGKKNANTENSPAKDDLFWENVSVEKDGTIIIARSNSAFWLGAK